MASEDKAAPASKKAPETKKRSSFESIVESLRDHEETLSEAHVSYQAVKAGRAKDHPIHAAHNNLGEHAARELGRAHGAIVQALTALEAFASKDETAKKSHAEAEKAKAEKLDEKETTK